MFFVNILIMITRPLILIFLFFSMNGNSQSVLHRVDSLMKSIYRPTEPGAVIAIRQKQKIIFKKSYGLADLKNTVPVSAEGNFNIGSLTKQFTAFAVLDLCYRGLFSLDDSIGRFLKLPPLLAAIRISQLLNHSSGIPDHYGFTDTNRVKHATDKDVLDAVQSASTLYFTSGTGYRYSNTAYCLLGMLIEKISGITYPAFLEKEIFRPLGINNASVFQMTHPIPDRVIGYELSKDGRFYKSDAEESIFFSTEADGGIYISMDNYLKWCAAVESGIFSGTPMIRQSWKKQTPVDSLRGLWYGNGWFILQSADKPKIVYHSGSNGGFRTVVFMIPSIDYCISIFSNRDDIDLEDLVAQINLILRIPHNSFIKSGPLESFIHCWPKFAPCKETRSFLTSSIKNLNARDTVLN
jgi:D-alanyl-D-alanine carboxypeptidase